MPSTLRYLVELETGDGSRHAVILWLRTTAFSLESSLGPRTAVALLRRGPLKNLVRLSPGKRRVALAARFKSFPTPVALFVLLMRVQALSLLLLTLPLSPSQANAQVMETLSTPVIPSGIPGESFLGREVAVDGDALVASSPGLDLGQAGSLWSYWKVAGSWQAGSEILRTEAEVGDRFGWALDMQGDSLVVSAAAHSAGPRLYVFDRVGNDWQQSQIISLPGSSPSFGESLSISGDRFVTTDYAPNGGITHVYREAGGSWGLEQSLTGYSGPAVIDGDRLVTEANGPTLAFFDLIGSSWTEVASFTYPNPLTQFQRPALHGDLCVLPMMGELRLYERAGGTWTATDRLRGSIRYSSGSSHVSIDDDRIVATCAPFSFEDNGWVSQWVRESESPNLGASWSERKLLRFVGSFNDVRLTVDFDGETLAVGDWNYRPSPPNTARTGAIYTAELDPASDFVGDSFCHGFDAPCPCGFETGYPGGPGCQGSTPGSLLVGEGSASVAMDDLKMSAFGLPPQVSALLFWGTETTTTQLPFGNGLRCAGGTLQRTQVRQANDNGRANWGQGPSDFGPAGSITAGDELVFQVWYRDPDAFCAQGFNLTNGFRLTMTP